MVHDSGRRDDHMIEDHHEWVSRAEASVALVREREEACATNRARSQRPGCKRGGNDGAPHEEEPARTAANRIEGRANRASIARDIHEARIAAC